METEKKLTVRLPIELHAEIARLAEKDLRSLNAEIVKLLQEAVEARRG